MVVVSRLLSWWLSKELSRWVVECDVGRKMDELAMDCGNALMVLAQGHRNDEAATADTTLAETHSLKSKAL
jgi:hypothetical protein